MTLFEFPEETRPGLPISVIASRKGAPKPAIGAAIPPVAKLRTMPQFSWLSDMSDDAQILQYARSWAWVEMDGEVQPVPNMLTMPRHPATPEEEAARAAAYGSKILLVLSRFSSQATTDDVLSFIGA